MGTEFRKYTTDILTFVNKSERVGISFKPTYVVDEMVDWHEERAAVVEWCEVHLGGNFRVHLDKEDHYDENMIWFVVYCENPDDATKVRDHYGPVQPVEPLYSDADEYLIRLRDEILNGPK